MYIIYLIPNSYIGKYLEVQIYLTFIIVFIPWYLLFRKIPPIF